DGTFAPPDRVSSPRRAAPVVADFNGDGLPDVAVLRQDGAILVRFADPGAPGEFEPPVIINPAPGDAAREISLLNVRGKKYLLALSARGDSLWVFKYRPEQGFVRTVTVAVPDGLADHMVTGDINGDGIDSVVLTQPATGQILMETIQDYQAGLP